MWTTRTSSSLGYPFCVGTTKEEFSHLATYPHHHHDERGAVRVSPLSGEPETDLRIILKKVSDFLG